MRKILWLVPILALAGCAASNVASTPTHKIRLANADLAAALNKIEATALQANQAGVITTAETISVSNIINNATIASDGIENCVENSAQGAISGCIAPLIQSIQSKMTLSGLGIKSAGATSNFQLAINGVLATLTEVTTAETGL